MFPNQRRAGINVIKGFIKEKYFRKTTKENETGWKAESLAESLAPHQTNNTHKKNNNR